MIDIYKCIYTVIDYCATIENYLPKPLSLLETIDRIAGIALNVAVLLGDETSTLCANLSSF